MQNRTRFLARLNERLSIIETALKKIGSADELQRRLVSLENSIYLTKKVLTFEEACLYMGVSESLLYKLTSSKEVPHYKPRGKMLYFNKEELDQWLLQNKMPIAEPAKPLCVDSRSANSTNVPNLFEKDSRNNEQQ